MSYYNNTQEHSPQTSQKNIHPCINRRKNKGGEGASKRASAQYPWRAHTRTNRSTTERPTMPLHSRPVNGEPMHKELDMRAADDEGYSSDLFQLVLKITSEAGQRSSPQHISDSPHVPEIAQFIHQTVQHGRVTNQKINTNQTEGSPNNHMDRSIKDKPTFNKRRF